MEGGLAAATPESYHVVVPAPISEAERVPSAAETPSQAQFEAERALQAQLLADFFEAEQAMAAAVPQGADEAGQPDARQPGQPIVRNWSIFRRDIETYGTTDHCPGCLAVITGGRGSHTPACRARIQAHLQASPEGRERLERATARALREMFA